jgi:radical SAM superfamily enzyme YgiQ (UPF0313 family)
MSKLQFQIICPAAPQFRIAKGETPSFRTRIFRFSMLSALSVAACAPPGVIARVVDENVEPIDFDTDADVIGVSFMTFNAPRAYEIAREFRARGKTVFFGGYHPTLAPEEAAEHADAVCIGDAEVNLPRMLEDYGRGELKKFYRYPYAAFRAAAADPGLLRTRDYMWATVVQATRGCSNRCEFCSISAFSEHAFRMKPIDEVAGEIRAGRKRRVLFMDDNLAGNMEYFRELLEALIPLRVRWYSQIGFPVTRDPQALDLMRRSGCRGLFIGLESLVQQSLAETGKGFNLAAEYRGGIEALHRRGIAVIAAFVLGYDHDDAGVFDRTLRFLNDARADALQLTVLTPFPGTPLYQRLQGEGRIFDRDWQHYDLGHVVFLPRKMTASELEAGHNRMLDRFYSWSWILRRMLRQVRYLGATELALLGLINWGYRLKIRRDGYLPRGVLMAERRR